MMRKALMTSTVALVMTIMGTGTALGQSLDTGLAQFDREAFEEAALTFYDVAARDPDANERNEALVYLALTLQ
ncbi:MAG: hypothetical protein AAFQ82_24010, partial [Myxococcota bacterium]